MKKITKILIISLVILILLTGCEFSSIEDIYSIQDGSYRVGETVDMSYDYFDHGRFHKRITVTRVIRGTENVYRLIGEPNMWEPDGGRQATDRFVPDPTRFESFDEYILIKVRVQLISVGKFDELLFKRDDYGVRGFSVRNNKGDKRVIQATETDLQPELIGSEMVIQEGETREFWINNLVAKGEPIYLHYYYDNSETKFYLGR